MSPEDDPRDEISAEEYYRGMCEAQDARADCLNCGVCESCIERSIAALEPDLSSPEPLPTPNASRPVWELVIEDMRARDQFGRAKYGTPLQSGNGRDALVDAYQEALDLCVYLRTEIEERAAKQALIEALADRVHKQSELLRKRSEKHQPPARAGASDDGR